MVTFVHCVVLRCAAMHHPQNINESAHYCDTLRTLFDDAVLLSHY